MGFNSIPQAWINSGSFVIQSLMQYIKDNFDSLNSSVVGVGASDVPNGSFEIDSDSNGVPDTWTQNLYPGGAAVLDATTQAKAGKSLKLTSPGGAGNGGAYYDSDYVPCNEGAMVNLAFSHKSSDAGIHNQVILRWYTSAKVYVSSTTIYNDATTNPTSWTRFIRGAAPVSTARYFKVRLDGANSDDATAGSAWFDDVGTVGGVNTVAGYTTGENATSTAGFDRIYIAGGLASTTGFTLAPSGVATGIAGGSVAITARTSGAAVQGTLTLVLPEGKWSIFVTAENTFVSADPDLFHHKINAIAFREG